MRRVYVERVYCIGRGGRGKIEEEERVWQIDKECGMQCIMYSVQYIMCNIWFIVQNVWCTVCSTWYMRYRVHVGHGR